MSKISVPEDELVLPLDSTHASLDRVGGKGANLALLTRSGFRVPGGFLITTEAYRTFVRANQLDDCILSLLPSGGMPDPQQLEISSASIQAAFSRGDIPKDVENNILDAYAELGEKCVAVRSSATAEDLPDLSFAGQQDTYLNVLGRESLIRSIVACWGSLWTARAIGYRIKNRIPNCGISIAVVVQEMVESQVSGVLFTSNPLTGLRTETVIDAAFGLGEALVSGQVEPDHYVVATGERRILSKALGAKVHSIHGQAGGGTRTDELPRKDIQALPDSIILDLANLGKQVESLYGYPQDIEWAWADEQLHLLQSRPITSLYPIPEGLSPVPLKVLFSFGAVQGMLDPMTPVGISALDQFAVLVGGLVKEKTTSQTQALFYEAGQRLWVNITAAVRNPLGRRLMPYIFTMVEPSTRQAILQILDDPHLQSGKNIFKPKTAIRVAGLVLPLAANLLINILFPRHRREYIVANGERQLKKLEAEAAAVQGNRWQKLGQIVDLFILEIGDIPHTFILFVSAIAAGMASWNFLNMLSRGVTGEAQQTNSLVARDLVLQITRGMPYNPTTEMDLALWEMAKELRQDPGSLEALVTCSPNDLSSRYLARTLPIKLQTSIGKFMGRYGGRGLGEIDLGRIRWNDDPAHVFEMLSSFLQIEDVNLAPDLVFARGAEIARAAIDQLAGMIRRTRFGFLKAPLIRFFAGRARQLMGARENPKFLIVRILYVVQRKLLGVASEFVAAGDMDSPDDILYLSFAELKTFASQQKNDWRGLIARRREIYQRELQRKQIPRLLLSDGRAFYAGITASSSSANVLNGSPVSPGSVQGCVRVVFDPRHAHLQPGEIMVCKGTDPSWTPLFLSAAGLIMETGGMMTHGSVVAREYGIPAIVGVDRATTRLKTGQMVRLDGSSGQIVLVEE